MTITCLFLDVEATRRDERGRPWEIALIREPALRGHASILMQITDVDLTDADPESLRISGFYDRHIRYSSGPRDPNTLYTTESGAASLVEEWTRSAQLIGLAPSHDVAILGRMLLRRNRIGSWDHRLNDICNIAAGYLQGQAQTQTLHGCRDLAEPIWSNRAPSLSRACGVAVPDDDERHTALGGTRWVHRWWKQMFVPDSGTAYTSLADAPKGAA